MNKPALPKSVILAAEIGEACINAGDEAPFSFDFEGFAIHDPQMTDNGMDKVDTREYYGEAYKVWEAELEKGFIPVLQPKKSTFPVGAMRIENIEFSQDSVIVKACPLGGGFVHNISIENALEIGDFVNAMTMPTNWEQGHFSIDGDKGFKGFHTGHLWNGWACPSFTAEQVPAVLEYLYNPAHRDGAEIKTSFSKEKGVSVYVAYDKDDVQIDVKHEGSDIFINGEMVRVYSLCDGLCWDLDD